MAIVLSGPGGFPIQGGGVVARTASSPATADPRHSKYLPSASSKGTSRAKPSVMGGNEVSLARTVPAVSRSGSWPNRASPRRMLLANTPSSYPTIQRTASSCASQRVTLNCPSG